MYSNLKLLETIISTRCFAGSSLNHNSTIFSVFSFFSLFNFQSFTAALFPPFCGYKWTSRSAPPTSLKKVSFCTRKDPKSGPLNTQKTKSLAPYPSPFYKTKFLAHFVAKSGPFCTPSPPGNKYLFVELF